MKEEPEWMLAFRLKALAHFQQRSCQPGEQIFRSLIWMIFIIMLNPLKARGKTWDDVPDKIKKTFDHLGIPEAERKFLAGVGAQYESEMVYHSIQEHLEKQGVIFLSIEDGLRQITLNYSENTSAR